MDPMKLIVLILVLSWSEGLQCSNYQVKSTRWPGRSIFTSKCVSRCATQLGIGANANYLESINGYKREDQNDNNRHQPGPKGRRVLIRRAVALVVGSCLVFSMSRAAAAAAGTISEAVVVDAAATSTAAAATSATTMAAPSSPLFLNAALSSAFWEIRLSLRLIFAALTGAAIGKERSGFRYHPAGVRTMSLVALGAALFTVCSRHGFAGHYDTSRMASNVASGVGFIGAGVIYHEHKSDKVHGLTTAAAIWISAAVGVTCGTGLFVVAAMSTFLTLAILRIGGAVKFRRKTKLVTARERAEERATVERKEELTRARKSRENQQKPKKQRIKIDSSDIARFLNEPKIRNELLNSTDWVLDGDEEPDTFFKNLKEHLWSKEDPGAAP